MPNRLNCDAELRRTVQEWVPTRRRSFVLFAGNRFGHCAPCSSCLHPGFGNRKLLKLKEWPDFIEDGDHLAPEVSGLVGG